MWYFILFATSFFIGYAIGQKVSNWYWVKRIKGGNIPSRANAKFWKPNN